jgi:23S rRNA (pseudouridine1915-N3)-methyltransferase
MQIDLVAVGTKMPSWVDTAWKDYTKRLPKEWKLNLVEIPAGKRGKNAPIQQILQDEGRRALKAAAHCDTIIALDRVGKPLSSHDLANCCSDWLENRQKVAVLIGGPEGLSDDCLAAASKSWSLSAMTLPHPVVRVVLAEQVFRAWSILNNHPYHR